MEETSANSRKFLSRTIKDFVAGRGAQHEAGLVRRQGRAQSLEVKDLIGVKGTFGK
jgi:hypothetical protein